MYEQIASNKRRAAFYVFVFLVIWTGVGAAIGLIFYPSQTNPDGTHYHDPGIRWISYFHGGDALHEFPRASFGTPQSLGCVELPEAAAAAVWPYTPIGTLVTIES